MEGHHNEFYTVMTLPAVVYNINMDNNTGSSKMKFVSNTTGLYEKKYK